MHCKQIDMTVKSIAKKCNLKNINIYIKTAKGEITTEEIESNFKANKPTEMLK